jgi:hypothetical protein
VSSSKKEVLSFVGSTIMRRTDVVVSNKKFFSNSGGLGPVNIGSEDWRKAKERQERIAQYQSAHLSHVMNDGLVTA